MKTSVAHFYLLATSAHNRPQIGLEVKAKDVEDLVETVEITDEVDEEQEIRNEVRIDYVQLSSF